MHTTELGVVVVALAVLLTSALVRHAGRTRRRDQETPEQQCRREIRALRQDSGRYLRPRRVALWAAGAPSQPRAKRTDSKTSDAGGCGGCGGGCGGCGGC
jgi:type II secretory pathway pseudopilin PulG